MMCVNLIIVHLKINITFPNNLGANGIAPSPNKDESQENNESMVKEVHGECGSISIHCPLNVHVHVHNLTLLTHMYSLQLFHCC